MKLGVTDGGSCGVPGREGDNLLRRATRAFRSRMYTPVTEGHKRLLIHDYCLFFWLLLPCSVCSQFDEVQCINLFYILLSFVSDKLYERSIIYGFWPIIVRLDASVKL